MRETLGQPASREQVTDWTLLPSCEWAVMRTRSRGRRLWFRCPRRDGRCRVLYGTWRVAAFAALSTPVCEDAERGGCGQPPKVLWRLRKPCPILMAAATFLASLREIEWVVYAKEPFANPTRARDQYLQETATCRSGSSAITCFKSLVN